MLKKILKLKPGSDISFTNIKAKAQMAERMWCNSFNSSII